MIKNNSAILEHITKTLFRMQKLILGASITIRVSNTDLTTYEKEKDSVRRYMVGVRLKFFGDSGVERYAHEEEYDVFEPTYLVRARMMKCFHAALGRLLRFSKVALQQRIALASAMAEVDLTLKAYPVLREHVTFTDFGDVQEAATPAQEESPAVPPPVPTPKEPSKEVLGDASFYYRILVLSDGEFTYLPEVFLDRASAKKFLKEQGLIKNGWVKRIRRLALRGTCGPYTYEVRYYAAKMLYFVNVYKKVKGVSVVWLSEPANSVREALALVVQTAGRKGK